MLVLGLVLITGVVVTICGFLNTIVRKRLELLYLLAGAFSGVVAGIVLNEMGQRSEEASNALEKLGTISHWLGDNTGQTPAVPKIDAVGPAMYLILICATVLILCLIVSGVAKLFNDYADIRDSKRA